MNRLTSPALFSLLRTLYRLLGLALLVAAGVLVADEMQTARLQSREFSRFAATLHYAPDQGPTDAMVYPAAGPFDRRLGYTQLPRLLERLQQRSYTIHEQVRFSPALADYAQRGYFPPYGAKARAGLAIDDCTGESMHRFLYPAGGYDDFDGIPAPVVDSLLFIENRALLDEHRPLANPAVDWPRFLRAVLAQLGRRAGLPEPSAGGASTLATQLEKYRHSPDGLTVSNREKLRQMVSASVRAYRAGPETLAARRQIVLDYLNTVPLAAYPGYGEVHGLADGLHVWYGADFAAVNQALDPRAAAGTDPAARALALRQVLSLLIAQRRPSYYLVQGRADLAALTDSYLRLMADAGLIEAELAAAALGVRSAFRSGPLVVPRRLPDSAKGIDVARSHLSRLLGLTLYDLDRLDLVADTTLDAGLQEQVTAYLRRLTEPEFAAQAGLFGERLLAPEKTHEVRYSFTLLQRTPEDVRVRVQTDSTGQPFDINEGSKLELGSTAKLRVLVTYLEIVAELHARFAGQGPEDLAAVEVAAGDRLTRWALDYLRSTAAPDLPAMLSAALDRRYSASPDERFFTGGGMHRFGNFRREDNARNPTVREALRESINLPFIRLMRDIVQYTIHQAPGGSAELLRDDEDPRREDYLRRFADREGRTFLLRFWRKYRDLGDAERLEAFLAGVSATPVRLAAAHRYLFPEAEPASFVAFMRERLPRESLEDGRLALLHGRYGPGAHSLPDQGYLARVHPLELWLVGYLLRHPQADFEELVAASVDERQEVYGWLFRSRRRGMRDNRIRIMLEVEAFLEIHRRWQRLGYPFGFLVPSLATALGSSGDRPAALAELMGILQNDGVRRPPVRITELRFAADTPWETTLRHAPAPGQQVLAPEVAAAAREVLSTVVEGGTARRLRGAFRLADGTPVAVGGKTGTGDNRIETVGPRGEVLSSRVQNRTATFVFYLGTDHFGTLTAFVPGSAAERFTFTSALPVQVLNGLVPILLPHLEPGGRCVR